MERRYTFWLETYDGHRIEWRSLSERQAREMYNRTRVAHPYTVHLFGWGPNSNPDTKVSSSYREAFTYL